MEPMDIFYQILHEDLNPLTSLTTQKLLQKYSKTKTNDNLKTSSKKFDVYKVLLSDTLKKVKRDIHHKVFQCLKDPKSIQSIIQNHQILILNYCRVIEQTYLGEDQNSKFEISGEQTDTDIFKLVYQTLDAILDYLEVSFYKYLEHSLEMPYQRKL